jgi:5-methylcytosine-specific restriction protein B
MTISDLINKIDVWDNWRSAYKSFVPRFITEAAANKDWVEWDKEVFDEYFERGGHKSVSSLRQGYFTNADKEKIKANWSFIAPLLSQIALAQDSPQFDIYEELKQTIRKYTASNREAATYRLVASLQPKLLCTIVNHNNLKQLIRYLEINIDQPVNKTTNNWFRDSNYITQILQQAAPSMDATDLVTLPWQIKMYFDHPAAAANEIANIDMSDIDPEVERIAEVLYYKKQIILQGPPGTGKTKLAKELAEMLIAEEKLDSNNDVLTPGIIKSYMKPGLEFPSAKDGVQYVVDSVTSAGVSVKAPTGNLYIPTFSEILKAYDNQVWTKIGSITKGNDSYSAAIAKYIFINRTLSSAGIENSSQFKIVQFHPSYTYEDFVRGIVAESRGLNIEYKNVNKLLGAFAQEALINWQQSQLNDDVKELKYVLVIDEINRANLSAVLGELIYALEYRGSVVNSVYEIGDDKGSLVLPNNLYIIGTMNTADRSVGHIDYAIRRRFAFVDVLSQDLTEDLKEDFHHELYNEVKRVFKDPYLSPEFQAKDVELGHSYFIQQYHHGKKASDITKRPHDFRLRIKYEILPILREYVRDGILYDTAKTVIEKIEDSYLNGL